MLVVEVGEGVGDTEAVGAGEADGLADALGEALGDGLTVGAGVGSAGTIGAPASKAVVIMVLPAALPVVIFDKK